MGAALSLECYVLREWLQSQGLGPVGITGISLGGHVRLYLVCVPLCQPCLEYVHGDYSPCFFM